MLIKRIMRRGYVILAITIAFLVGLGILAFRVVKDHNDWVSKPFNGHIQSQIGTITDRNGNKLAYTDSNNDRQYSDSYDTRCALLHVVGDETLNISTSIQSMYGNKLNGYNFIFGMGLPKSMRINTDIKLTVDTNSSTAAYNALGGKRGACVVYNYKTGEVLCDTSSLAYDPLDPPEITEENEDEWRGAYIDNVVASSYTPGSTFKIITAASAIENIPDIYEQTFDCCGYYEVDGELIKCNNDEAHGAQTFEQAFANSCNCAFAQMALQLGEENLTRTAKELGFNQDFTMSNITLRQSHYDVSKAKSDYDLAWSGIGQYTDLANPLHMAIICGGIANGGTPVKPYIVSNATEILKEMGLDIGGSKGSKMLDSDVAQKVEDLMYGAANAYGMYMSGLEFCAKTGTAEIGEDKEPNAWFVGYTKDSDHPYAFACVVEEGGYGISAAAPVVQAAIESLVNG